MKKKILIITIMTILAVSITACAYKKSPNGNESNGGDSTDVEEDAKEDSSNNTPPKNTEPNEDNSDKDNNENKDSLKVELLDNIQSKAESGMVINSEFKSKDNVIDEAVSTYGEEDTKEYIDEAKGTYYTFESKKLAFGVNKGSQIFEARSFDDSLKNLSLKDITSYFGQPQYEFITSTNEKIIGYVVNDDFKLLFVFSDSENESAILDHYSVLYPRGTVNNMANDPGREW